ncbi:hypothetical protein BJG91_01300 (plasmid) [Bacillus thuringiensis]|nr:hypothetical protein BJG91_01300 [Bacillus thuringiensis]
MQEFTTNARKNCLDKVATEIIQNHDVIGIENLQVSNMLKNHKLAKAIIEVSLPYRKHLFPANYVFVVHTKIKALKNLNLRI